MNYSQKNTPLTLNMDKSQKKLGPAECFFLRNHERRLSYDGTKRGTLGKASPLAANYMACEMNKPAGENYAVGEYYSPLTNETYSWVFNSNNIHYIQRINGDGDCEVVYVGCLQLSAEPQHAIHNNGATMRAYLKVEKLCANHPGGVRKTLIWTNGIHDIGAIDVEASIATDSFDTPFFQRCTDPCELIKLCVPDPCGCLKGQFVQPTDSDATLSNNILDTSFMMSYRHVYYDGRKSIFSDPSKPFFQSSRGCFETGNFPRCIKLRVPIGNALVEKIEIAYKKDGRWYLYDTIEKYKKYNSSQELWFERELSEDVQQTFSESDCAFDYLFCNDKKCEAIAPEEINTRVYNPIPREVQGLFEVGIGNESSALAYYNYKKGSCPVDQVEAKKITITPDCTTSSCQAEMVTLTIRAIIHNFEFDRNQPIFRLGGGVDNAADDTSDTAFFGGLNDVNNGGLEIGFGQRFFDKTRNFICYIEGTDYWGEMKQWKSQPYFTQREEWGTLANFDDGGTKRRWRRAIKNGEFFYQEIKIKVPRGTRGFIRITSHESTGNDQDKSTFVAGTLSDIRNYKGNLDITSSIVSEEEIYFDACESGDQEIYKTIVIQDNAIDDNALSPNPENKSSAYHGYIKDGNGLPVEGAVVKGVIGSTVYASSKTDHNGFYHFYLYPGENDAINIEARVEQSCGTPFATLAAPSVLGEKGKSTRHDITIADESYKSNFLATVKVKIVDCGGVPVGGIRVALSGGKYKTSGPDGFAIFKIRNYETRDRDVRTVVLNNGGCFTFDCLGNCSPCMPSVERGTSLCYQQNQVFNMGEVLVNRYSATLVDMGLKSGGRYGWGVRPRGRCGRIGAVTHLSYMDIPRTQDKMKDSFCRFNYSDSGSVWPSWVDCVDIVRTENINDFELQWVVDKIERTDDGKIKLTIQSLNDYNEKHFFKTNTIYQWLQNDRVEFIKNGDGTIFNSSVVGLLNYVTLNPFHDEQVSGQETAAADYFNQLLIHDDGRLDSLKEGAIIELQRKKLCETEQPYWSICVSIPVVDGSIVYPQGVFETYDTFFVNRKIGKFPLQRFEHHSPSDFWGSRVSDVGRGYFVNKYENEKRYGRNITIAPADEFNRFGDIEKTLNPNMHGDIVAIIVSDNKIGIVISETDNSLIEIGDDLLRVGNDRVVRVASSDQIISDSNSKVSGAYGCPYELIGGINSGDGFVSWFDGYNYIYHDYNQAVPVDSQKCNSFFTRKGQELFLHNKSQLNPFDKIRVCSGQSQATGVVHTTFKTLRDAGYTNEVSPFIKRNETIMFDPGEKDFAGFASFTAEAYGSIELNDGKGCAFIAYLHGVPYIHPIIPEKWNEFFGVACDWMIGVTLNIGDEKVKRPLSMEIQSETLFFAKEITTEKTNFKSEIPASRWKRKENKWNSAFLGNINSRGGLWGDEKPKGFYCSVLLIRDNTDGLKYNTIDNNKRTQYSELDNIFFKFAIVEQSGFTENV